MMAMTACELLWPLFGNGPLYSRVADHVADKCTKNWWRNLLFINNYGIDTIDIVSLSLIHMLTVMKVTRAYLVHSAAVHRST